MILYEILLNSIVCPRLLVSIENMLIVLLWNPTIRGQFYDKVCADVFLAFYLDWATKGLNEILADRQTKTDTILVLFLRCIIVKLPEVLEELGLVLFVDADARVSHNQPEAYLYYEIVVIVLLLLLLF